MHNLDLIVGIYSTCSTDISVQSVFSIKQELALESTPLAELMFSGYLSFIQLCLLCLQRTFSFLKYSLLIPFLPC